MVILLLCCIQEATATPPQGGKPRSKLATIYNQAVGFARLYPDSALECRNQLEAIAIETGNDSCYYYMAGIDAWLAYCANDLVKAIEHGNRQVEIANQMGVRAEIIYAKATLTQIYGRLGSHDIKVKVLHEILLELEQLQSEIKDTTEYKFEWSQNFSAGICQNMSLSYKQLEEWESALHYANEASALYQRLDNQPRVSIVELMSAEYHHELGHDSLALDALQNAMQSFVETDNAYYIAIAHQSFADHYLETGQLEKAQFHARAGMAILDTIPADHLDRSFGLVLLGKVSLAQGFEEKALEYADQALAELKNPSDIDLRGILDLRWRAYQQMGAHENAMKSYLRLTAINDSLEADEKRLAVIRSDIKYNFQHKIIDDSLKLVSAEADLQQQALVTEHERKRTSLILIAASILGLGALVFILFAINRNRIIRRQKAQLALEYDYLKEFTENASHEMQTPMAVIHSKIERLLNSKNLTEKELNDMDIVASSAEHLSKLNRTLLLLAKIDNSQFPLTEAINATEIVSNQIEQLEEIISASDIELSYELDNAKLIGNPMLFRMLVSNLLSNAIKYNVPNGKIQVRLRQNQLLISNTGKELGVEPEALFDRFVKDDNQETGTGLGLAIVKKICDSHQWLIQYEHEEGQHTLTASFG